MNPTGAKGQLTLTQGGQTETDEIGLGAETDPLTTPWPVLRRQFTPPPPATLRERSVSSREGLAEVLARAATSSSDSGRPIWYRDFLETASVRFIETQRLVRLRLRQAGWPDPSSDSTVPTVLERSAEFGERLRETLASYGTQAQMLDQTFPQRLMAARNSLPDGELQERMRALKTQTDQLEALGILDEAADQASHRLNVGPDFADEQADAMTARVMTLYVEDTEKKLRALADLSSRLRSLLDSLNGKFRHKQLRLDRKQGLVAETSSGGALPLDSLSSGEQHELVLHYDLLFRTRRNTIVLIDEPELSLHVSWQKRFLSDLLEFAKLSGFDAIVATHSPYIIGERDDLMVGLGDEV